MSTTVDVEDILRILPHRYPFVLLDRVLDMKKCESIQAIKNVTINEQFFTGHFPVKPVMPGVLIVESMAQACGILAYHSVESVKEGDVFLLAGVDKVRFKKVVRPGDQIVITMRVQKQRQNLWKLEGEAKVDDQVACCAELMIVSDSDES